MALQYIGFHGYTESSNSSIVNFTYIFFGESVVTASSQKNFLERPLLDLTEFIDKQRYLVAFFRIMKYSPSISALFSTMLENFTEIDLYQANDLVTDSVLSFFGNICGKSIKSIKLDNCKSITENGLTSLLKNCKALTSLTVTNCK